MKIKRNLKGLALVVSCLMMTACGSLTQTQEKSNDQADVIKIGGNWELSGATAGYGSPGNEGVELAVDKVNQAGGLLGKQVEYVALDNKSTSEETTANTSRLISNDQVSLIIGPATTGLMEAQISSASSLPVIAPMATGDRLTTDSSGKVLDNVFRVCFQDAFQGQALAKFSNDKQFKRAVLIRDNSTDYGQNLTNEFKKYFQGEVLDELAYNAKDTDFNSLVTRLKSKEPDVIFVAGYYEEAGPLIKQAREQGVKAAILGPDGFGNQELIDLAGKDNMTDVYYTAHYTTNDPSPELKEFMEAYQEKFGHAPDMFAALAYDGARLAFDAIERAQSVDSKALNQTLAETKDFSGVTGSFTINDQHNPIKTAYVQELDHGEIVDTTPIEP
ncbi:MULTISPECIES: ABC transporter substrate-binding protein [Aerococcus]|uniref:ABC transporter substrate-binding protein n=1 Tax=Aerococcus urinae (strain CCUG 59500 / ACS-120-V-Col10a) TaxID=2976812 RepID=UPI000200F571|nr:ABC transporter substrate-binding protein [Aerococcus sp. Group 1]AEA01246.1 receptor family ligand-binding protein [Aerococcus sp. Group 1]MCY3030299.1 ABC transporter substrate-binding protein [Aerococcus sp. Group 1]MCY3054986.1 ABC transporter substrate-binding protein [Aerococcus sp. Group 1]MCY3056716.1 ABC transporter substrate-binding protein [Aerococcus sp. Group 1]MCY3061487.1 ABC transporter substrate-binding protein [Aerococcus sp. Group 1]